MFPRVISHKPLAISWQLLALNKKITLCNCNLFTKLLPFAFCLLPFLTNAQCAMCRAALISEGNKATAEAVNDGIVFLMAVPYILAAGIGFVIYRMYRKKKV